jgi:Zn finger protein HypA/HybF involved in hydrogenase expression
LQENPLNPSERYDRAVWWEERVTTWCEHLGDTELRVTIASNGAVQVREHCLDCDRPVGPAISHKVARERGADIEALPVHVDYRKPGSRCERCRTAGMGVEYHHWAPYHLFGAVCEEWPGAFLCPACHNEWHRIVTPDMARRRAS